MKFELSISADYLPNWGMLEGVREILQNGRDAETEFSAKLHVSVRNNDTLVVQNDGCTIPREAFLMGHTSKVARGDLIGKFGEGFKLGILALLRAGHAVKIRNGSEVWIPEIVQSERYNSRVLAFEVSKGRKDTDRVQIEIAGITDAMYANDIKPRFLWLSRAVANCTKTDAGTLLRDPAYKGKIYVKGILVEEKPTLTVGYDLHDADVDRDRRMVSSWDFGWKTRQIWREAIAREPDLFGQFHEILESNGPEVQNFDAYDARQMSPEFMQHCTDEFTKLYGDKAFPVANLGESAELEHFGRRGVIVNGPMHAVLTHKMGQLDVVREQLKNEVTKTYSWHELHEDDKNNLMFCINLVNPIARVTLEEIEIVDFRSQDLQGVFSGGKIQIAAKMLGQLHECLLVLVHETAHRNGGDGEKGHVAELERIWSQIVKGMLK
jgi:hypothetical protein